VSVGAWIFLITVWGTVAVLNAFCFWRVLSKKKA
jgi:hypothetical protein